MERKRPVFFAIFLLFAIVNPATCDAAPEAVFPGEHWEQVARSDLAGYGWSQDKLRAAFEYIRDSTPVTGLVVVDRGRIVFNYGDIEDLSYLASVRKSVLAILYGKYVEDGSIDLGKTLGELGIDDIGGLLDVEKEATIEQLLTARSGVYHPASNSGDNLADAPPRGSQEPGAYMLYNNWDFNAAGAIFEQETGVNIYDALEEQLAIPLQFEDWDREAQTKTGNLEVSRNPAYHMWLSTRDMARIGYLMLRRGQWNGEQVVSRDWLERISSVVTPLEDMNPARRREGYLGYGYMWWVWDGPGATGPFEGAFSGRGAMGQWITVFPAVDLVIAAKTNRIYRRRTEWPEYEKLIELLFAARDIEPAGPYPWVKTRDPAQRVDAIFTQWNRVESPGCAVGVAVDGLNVLTRAYGMADLENDVPNTRSTIFEAGSVSKQFTAAAIQLLAIEGKLSLDDDVRKYVPEVPDYGETITIRHMMNHTSGLRDWGSVAGISGWGRSQRTHTHSHVLDIVSRQSALNFPPGAEYSYSNTGYNLLAVIVSRVSGMSFAEFSKTRIFEPLGMFDTQWRDNYRRIVKGRSAAYSASEDGSLSINRPIEDVHGNGGLLTTVGDLLIWNRAMTDGRLGGSELLERMHSRGRLRNGRTISYAAGLRIEPFDGVRSVAHTGSTSGYKAFLGRYPDQKLSVALLCNVDNVDPGRLGGEIARVYLGEAIKAESPTTPASTTERPAIEIDPLAGLYRDTRSRQLMRLIVEAGHLRIDEGEILVPVSDTEFVVGGGDERLVFESSVGKHPTIRGFHGTYEEKRYERVDEAEATAADLAALEGEYHSDDAETTLVIRVEDGILTAWRRPDLDLPLRPVYRDAFEADSLGLVQFHRDEDGRVKELSVSRSRVYDMRFRRLDRQEDTASQR